MPNEVNVNRKTIDAAAMIDGASKGSVTPKNARVQAAPSIRAAQCGDGDDVGEGDGPQRMGEDRFERPTEEDRQEAHRDRDPADAGEAHHFTTRLVHSLIQSLRLAEIVAGSIEYGCAGRTSHFTKAAGSVAPVTTGSTYIWSGMSSWNSRLTMQATSASAPATLCAWCRKPP